MRLMPRNAQDQAAVEKITAMGWPDIAPVLKDILPWLRLAGTSPVGNAFARLVAEIGAPSAKEVSQALTWSRSESLKHALVTKVLPSWSRDALILVAPALQGVVTNTRSLNTDVLAIRLLARHDLADREWLGGWLRWINERVAARGNLAREVAGELARPLLPLELLPDSVSNP